jgi:CHASE2 domain-containing sensor protein
MKSLYLESLIATILTFIVMGLLYLIPVNIKVFNPVKEVLKGYRYTDLYYSRLYDAKEVDEEIVIVNIGSMQRPDIINCLELLTESEAAVIGVDILFEKERSDSTDLKLAALMDDQRVVGAYTTGESQTFSATGFRAEKEGYVNFIGEDPETSVIRYFYPIKESEEGVRQSFALAVLKAAGQETKKDLEDKSYQINYFGDHQNFISVEGKDLLEGKTTPDLAGKIILLGYAGDTYGDFSKIEDSFYTPLNKNNIGKSLPDMHGVVIHANIIKMMRDGEWITEFKGPAMKLVSFVICLLHVIPFIYFFVKKHLWYHLFAKLAQLVSSILILLICIYLFSSSNLYVSNTSLIVAVLLAVDVLYLYESLAAFVYKKMGIKSYFIHEH